MRVAHLNEFGVVINVVMMDLITTEDADRFVEAEQAGDIGDRWDGENFVKPMQITKTLDQVKQELSDEIERTVVAIYQKPVTLAREYELRENEAQAYKDSGYSGDLPEESLLGGFAAEAGLDLQSAANRVLAQAITFRKAEPILGNLRMRKYSIVRAETEEAARQIHDETMGKLKAVVAMIA